MKLAKGALLISLGIGVVSMAQAAPLSFTFMLCDLSSEEIDEEVDDLLNELKSVRATNSRSSQYRKHVEWHMRDTSRRVADVIEIGRCSKERSEHLTRVWERLVEAL